MHLLLLPLVLSAAVSSEELHGDGWSVEINDHGVLVRGPESGMQTVDGPTVSLAGHFTEWFGVSYEVGASRKRIEGVGIGNSPDWGGRPVVQPVITRTEPGRIAVTVRTPEMSIETAYKMNEDGDLLLACATLTNLSAETLADILYSREWRVAAGDGFSFPPDLKAPPAPEDVARILWMPDFLHVGESTKITFTYRPSDLQNPLGRVDVPLVLYTDSNWPAGLTISSTNGVSWGDFNQDGWMDFFACQSAELWENLNGQTWAPPVQLDGLLPTASFRYGSSFGDYDDDGLPDIVTEPRNSGGDQNMHLLHNLDGAGGFIDVAIDPAIVDVLPFGDSETACWADVDFDSDLDLFLPVYPAWAARAGPGNWFLENQGPTGPGGAYRFFERGVPVGLDNPANSARPEGAEFCDVDGDGDLELYSNGTLYKNRSQLGAPKFAALTEAASGIEFSQDYDEGCDFFDYDLDGDQDLVIAYCAGDHGVRMFESHGDGTFFLARQGIIDDPFIGLCLGLSTADWDNDGDLDLTTRQVFRQNMLMETGRRKFEVQSTTIPGSHRTSATPAWCDSDLDGDLDCLLGNWLTLGHFYENTTYNVDTPDPARRNVRVRVMRDSDSVEQGLETEFGASVELHLTNFDDGHRRSQFVSSSAGYLNQNEYTLHYALPADPTPGDPDTDLTFDLRVDFPSDPTVGLLRIDRFVNPELGSIDLAQLDDREIVVFRSGRVVINGCEFEPVAAAQPTTTKTSRLKQTTNSVPLSDLVPAPGSDWYVGIEFDTLLATGPLQLKEITFDGVLDANSPNCGSDPFRIAIWDVTDAANPARLPDSELDARRRGRNRRTSIRANVTLQPASIYRLVVRVDELRATAKSGPVTTGAVTVTGGLSFQDLAPCSGAAAVAAAVDPIQIYADFRFVTGPVDLWAEHGYALAGSVGEAQLSGQGGLSAGDNVTLTLSGAPTGTASVLFVGFEAFCQLYAGGTLLPSPDLLIPIVTGASGGWTLQASWPAGLEPGTTLYLQSWFADVGGPNGMAASNAVSATTPY